MIDFCATIGWICLDAEFYRALFERAKLGSEFQELDELRNFLKSKRIRLSRGEVMELHRLLTTREVVPAQDPGEATTRGTFSQPDDEIITAIESLAPSIQIRFPQDMELCAAVGLCCVDDLFREAFHAASSADVTNTAGLHKFLVLAEGDSPGFALGTPELEFLNALIRTGGEAMKNRLAGFQAEKWVQGKVHKHFGACKPGYTKKPYKHLSPQETAIELDEQEHGKQGNLKQELLKAKAII